MTKNFVFQPAAFFPSLFSPISAPTGAHFAIASVCSAFLKHNLPAYNAQIAAPAPFQRRGRGINCLGLREAADNKKGLIRNISAIGALYTSCLGLSVRDQQWIALALEACHKHGFSIATDLKISLFNVCAGSDFLCQKKVATPADLIVLCYIFHPTPCQLALPRERLLATQGASPQHLNPRAWMNAIANTRASAVVAFSIASRDPRKRQATLTAAAARSILYPHHAEEIAPVLMKTNYNPQGRKHVTSLRRDVLFRHDIGPICRGT